MRSLPFVANLTLANYYNFSMLKKKWCFFLNISSTIVVSVLVITKEFIVFDLDHVIAYIMLVISSFINWTLYFKIFAFWFTISSELCVTFNFKLVALVG